MLKRTLDLCMTASKALTRAPKFFYDDEKSMISNIRSSFTVKQITQTYKEIQTCAIPRTMSSASRKLAFFCIINDPTIFSDMFYALMKRFYANLLQIDPIMLSPEQCYNIIYFLRVSQRLWEYLNIDAQKINKTKGQLFNRVLKKFENLPFNRYCDFLQQLKKLNQISQIRRADDEAKVYEMCEKFFPIDEEQSQVDSLFHLLQIYQILLEQNPKSRPSTLYQKVCGKIIKLVHHVHLTPMIKLANINVANYENRALNEKERLLADASFCSILSRICQIIQIERQPTSLDVRLHLTEYIKDLQSQSSDMNQTLLGIALQVNRLLKIARTPSQIAKEELALQSLKQAEQQYEKYLQTKNRQQIAFHEDQDPLIQAQNLKNNESSKSDQNKQSARPIKWGSQGRKRARVGEEGVMGMNNKNAEEVAQKNRLQLID